MQAYTHLLKTMTNLFSAVEYHRMIPSILSNVPLNPRISCICVEYIYFGSRSDLQAKLAIDYGPDREFLFLNSQCYNLNVNE